MPAFVNYAHRGASEYAPENTMMSFNVGLFMGANGIETDVQLTKDGIPVLFHDDTLVRVTGEAGSIADYTFAELMNFRVKKCGLEDRIPTLEGFLAAFGFRPITFAIELKVRGTAKITADLVRKYGLEKKVVITSFIYEELLALRAYAPELEAGYLTKECSDELALRLKAAGFAEYCPIAGGLTKENVARWHAMGLRVRAWGVTNEALMHHAFEAGADGMTVNFPDKLTALLGQK